MAEVGNHMHMARFAARVSLSLSVSRISLCVNPRTVVGAATTNQYTRAHLPMTAIVSDGG